VPHHLERGLDRDRVRRDEQRVEQRRELLVDLAGGGDVAGPDQVAQLLDPSTDEMRGDRDDTDGTQAQVSERRPVVPAVDLEVRRRLGDELRDRLEVAGRVFHTDDVLHLGHPQQGVVLDPDAGPSRDVVRDDRDRDRVRHLAEVLEEPALRWLVVVRRDEQQPVGPELLGLARELEGLRRVVRPGAAQDLAASLRHLDHRAEELELLLVGEGRRFTGGAGHDERLRPPLEQVRGQRASRVEIQRVILVEGRDHGGDDRPEPTGHDASFGLLRRVASRLAR
jgi:hypothetical protein